MQVVMLAAPSAGACDTLCQQLSQLGMQASQLCPHAEHADQDPDHPPAALLSHKPTQVAELKWDPQATNIILHVFDEPGHGQEFNDAYPDAQDTYFIGPPVDRWARGRGTPACSASCSAAPVCAHLLMPASSYHGAGTEPCSPTAWSTACLA